jgi:hypothetical protein
MEGRHLMKATITFVLLLACLATDAAVGSIIVSYPSVSSLDPLNRSVAPDAVHAAVGAENLTAGAGLEPYDPGVPGDEVWFWTNWFDRTLAPDGSDHYALALAGEHTWTWGFEVAAANTSIDLDSLSFSVVTDNNAMSFDLQVQVNGGAPLMLLQSEGVDGSNSYFDPVISLSGVPTLTTGDTLLVTLIGYGQSNDRLGLFIDTGEVSAGPGALLVEGDVTLIGAVPEASSLITFLLLGAVSSLGIAGARGRMREAAEDSGKMAA